MWSSQIVKLRAEPSTALSSQRLKGSLEGQTQLCRFSLRRVPSQAWRRSCLSAKDSPQRGSVGRTAWTQLVSRCCAGGSAGAAGGPSRSGSVSSTWTKRAVAVPFSFFLSPSPNCVRSGQDTGGWPALCLLQCVFSFYRFSCCVKTYLLLKPCCRPVWSVT